MIIRLSFSHLFISGSRFECCDKFCFFLFLVGFIKTTVTAILEILNGNVFLFA